MSLWQSNKHGEYEINATVKSVVPYGDGSFTVCLEWDCSKLGWGQYHITFTHDGKFIPDSEYMDSEKTNFDFLGALLASVIENQK